MKNLDSAEKLDKSAAVGSTSKPEDRSSSRNAWSHCENPGCGKHGEEAHTLSACGRCLLAMYCCKACQRAHWPAHKIYCRNMRKEDAAVQAKFEAKVYEELVAFAHYFHQPLVYTYIQAMYGGDPPPKKPRPWRYNHLLVLLKRESSPPESSPAWSRFTLDRVQWLPINRTEMVDTFKATLDEGIAKNVAAGRPDSAVALALLMCSNAGRGVSFLIANAIDVNDIGEDPLREPTMPAFKLLNTAVEDARDRARADEA